MQAPRKLQDGRHRQLPPHYKLRPRLAYPWPVVPTRLGGVAYALVNQLLENEWREPEQIRARQLGQLRALLGHAAQHSPFYAERFRHCGLDPDGVGAPEDLRALPLLTRTDLQDNFDSIRARALPRGLKAGGLLSTSGATAAPVRVIGNTLNGLLWAGCTIRCHIWAGLDLTGRLASIRYFDRKQAPLTHADEGMSADSWGGPVAQVFVTGPCNAMHIGLDMDKQIAFLQKAEPDYILSYPSNLVVLGRTMAERSIALQNVKVVQTISEVLPPHVRSSIEESFGAPVFDMYSCVEVGYIAGDCPSGHGYHVHEENVLLEILDEEGEPCRPGQVGRVVVTGLTGVAFPLIRYDVGDYAAAAEPGVCPCGRGLMRLTRVVGRQRGQLIGLDGKVKFSSPVSVAVRDAGRIRQFQVIQHELDRVEVRIVPMEGFGARQEAGITRAVRDLLGAGVHVSFCLVERIERTPGGKYLDFVCKAQ